MMFHAPEWFFVVPALVVLGWRFRVLRLHEPVRALALLALVVALADPRARVGGNALDVWVLADRSDSVAATAAAQAGEVASILERSKRPEDRVFFVDYAVDAVRRDQGDPVFRGGTSLTRTGVALELALAQMAEDRASRLLVLSDGFSTEPLGDAAEKVLRRGVALDYRLTGDGQAEDYRAGAVSAPARVRPGEAFLVEFVITGRGGAGAAASADAVRVPWEVSRDGRVAAQGVAELRDGVARVRLTDRVGGGGAVRYEVAIRPAADAHPENNRAEAWVEVAGGARALLVTNYPDDPVTGLLRAQGFGVEIVDTPSALSAASLTGARLVVFNNVPAHRVAPEFLGALDFFVREQGGGLFMAGGENSFGAGGYFSSPVDPLLPVSMELRKEHRKLATAMAIVMDRSGSMAASAGGGLSKMDLANTGAARAVELLGEQDAVAVFAVDSTAHEIVPLTSVGPNRGKIINAVRRVESMGGGIYVYEGLAAGWKQLQRAQTGTRHLILFSDAADSEEPGDYKNLLAEMRAGGATVSVIGLGSTADSDARLLEDIARLGGGRMFFNANPADLPAIFAQETVSVARSAFIKEKTAGEGTPGWAEIAARAPPWPAAVDGYNLSYLRDGATASYVTTDEYRAPLVAAWARGAGRVAAVSFPLGGDHSTAVRGWAGYGDFVQTLGRWLAGENVPPGLGLRTKVEGERLSVELLHDETWAARVAADGPVVFVSVAAAGAGGGMEQTRELLWEKIEPGRFRVTTGLPPGGRVRGVVRVGKATLPFGPVTGASGAEWSFSRERVEELRQLSMRSGGRERLDLATIWDSPRVVSERSLRGWALAGALALVLLDALLTRVDVSLVRRRKSVS
ncbi:von Willebrand factor type A-like protein [Opitutaceae bacterium TAV1]|nr:von Willebrand factor type A-like protein [Opitutaceae bacterium TAV1]